MFLKWWQFNWPSYCQLHSGLGQLPNDVHVATLAQWTSSFRLFLRQESDSKMYRIDYTDVQWAFNSLKKNRRLRWFKEWQTGDEKILLTMPSKEGYRDVVYIVMHAPDRQPAWKWPHGNMPNSEGKYQIGVMIDNTGFVLAVTHSQDYESSEHMVKSMLYSGSGESLLEERFGSVFDVSARMSTRGPEIINRLIDVSRYRPLGREWLQLDPPTLKLLRDPRNWTQE